MAETLGRLSALQVLTYVVAVLTAILALDLWWRVARAFRVLNEHAAKTRRRFGAFLFAWLAIALALTLIAPLTSLADSQTWLQPVITLVGVAGVTMLMPGFRRAFDSLPIEHVLTLFYWRAVFGVALLAFYLGGVVPAEFALAGAA
jgi:uncharacterized membrane protein YuzA (DUF378 family)